MICQCWEVPKIVFNLQAQKVYFCSAFEFLRIVALRRVILL